MVRKQVVVFSIILAVVLALCATALADNYVYKHTTADTALARSLLVTRQDYPAGLKLKGGPVKPDESTDPCDTSRKRDLVVGGDAEARFSSPSEGIGLIDVLAGVFQSATMAHTDWTRDLPFSGPKALECDLRSAKTHPLKLLAYQKLGPTRCACDDSLSLMIETTGYRKDQRLIWVITQVRRGRVEAGITTVVARNTSDTSNAALNAAISIQGAGVNALSKRLLVIPGGA